MSAGSVESRPLKSTIDSYLPLSQPDSTPTTGFPATPASFSRTTMFENANNSSCEVIGPRESPPSCPCCSRRSIPGRGTLDEPALCCRRNLPSMLDVEEEDDEEQVEDDVLPGVLSSGTVYHPKRIIAEGWLYKKGSGMDWMGSRGWKARWARLLMARVDGYDVEVPLLSMYWYSAATTPSTVIVLDATVVMPVEKEDKTLWNSYRFDVVHARKTSGGADVTRTFSTSQKGRDTWVYTINQALLNYEKEKAAAKRASQALADAHAFRGGAMWVDDRIAGNVTQRPTSPVLSPRLSHSRIPRPVPLSPARRSLST